MPRPDAMAHVFSENDNMPVQSHTVTFPEKERHLVLRGQRFCGEPLNRRDVWFARKQWVEGGRCGRHEILDNEVALETPNEPRQGEQERNVVRGAVVADFAAEANVPNSLTNLFSSTSRERRRQHRDLMTRRQSAVDLQRPLRPSA